MDTDAEPTGDGGPPAPNAHAWKARPACPEGLPRKVMRVDDAPDRRYGRESEGWPVGVRPGLRQLAEAARVGAVRWARPERFDMRLTIEVEA